MKPVAIFRHSPGEGPGYFSIYLESQGIPWILIPIDAGAPVPADADAYAGLCFMGGPMSVNDPLPWVEPVCALIRDAVNKDIPVIGHCLGGQLISRALDGSVTRNPVKEIGWTTGLGETGKTVADWLGPFAGKPHTLFQWHGETFSLPAGAVRLMLTPACTNQMFALGPHLGMQCHVEMTPEMIANWCEQWADECSPEEQVATIQNPDAMHADMATRLPELRQLADQLYSRWVRGLRR